MKRKIIGIGMVLMLLFISVQTVNAREVIPKKTVEKYKTIIDNKIKEKLENDDIMSPECLFSLFRFSIFYMTCTSFFYGCVRCILWGLMTEYMCGITLDSIK